MTKLTGERFVLARKVSEYLLDGDHPDGAAKARFLMRFGFDPDDPDALLAALSSHPDANEVVATEATAFGIKAVVECSLKTPDGRNPCVRTVWILEAGSVIHRFVTAYPSS